jgi:hypothetical protein
MSDQERNPNLRNVTEREVPGTAGPGVITDVQREVRAQEPVTWEEMRSLLRREPTIHEPTWKPTTGGILSIIAGSWNVILGGASIFGATFLDTLVANFNLAAAGESQAIGLGLGIAMVVLGIISIIGGIMAISRRTWGFAMTGAVLAMFPNPIILPFFMGLFATLFVGLGKKEFKGQRFST